MPRPSPTPRPWPWPVLAAGGIVLAIAAVYANSLNGPFVFDDVAAIVDNASIRHLGDLPALLSPPSGNGITVDGRPGLNLSLALSYAVSGQRTWGYHALNVVIHALAALTLFGIVRRTIPRWLNGGARCPQRAGSAQTARHATILAALAALLWALHPLQTESVTYIVQRAESLMGLCYLFTLYGFVRATDTADVGASRRWLAVSCAACLFGMTTKEVMISAPLIVLLYDRAFASGSIGAALRRRWPYYAALALTSAVSLGLALHTGNRGGTAGLGIGVSFGAYWKTQFQALAHYLCLSFWPGPLIFDYGVRWTQGVGDYLPYALAIGALALATAAALWRRSAAGLLGAFSFLVLAPTSLIPGNRQTLAEHRMYLPLAAVIVWAVCGGYTLLGAARRRNLLPAGAAAALAIAVILGFLTALRNEDYRSELSLYRDTVAKRPNNASARDNYGNALRAAGRDEDAAEQYEEALRLRPDYYQAHYNLALALAHSGHGPQAIAHYEAALRLKPDYAEAQNNLGIALARSGRDREAIEPLRAAVRLNPVYVEAHYNLGLALARIDRMPEAIAELQTTLALSPGFAAAHTALGYSYQIVGRTQEAAEQFAAAAR